MFELKKRSKPNTFDECLQPDPVVTRLYEWANTVKRWGMYVCILFAIYGVISGVVSAIMMPEGKFFAFVSEFITELIYGGLVYASALCIGVLLIALANIVHNTRITANISMLNCAEKAETEVTKPTSGECPKPAPIESKKDAPSPYAPNVFTEKYWVCANCKTRNKEKDTSCIKCGARDRLF